MKRVMRFLICFVVLMAVSAGAFTLLFWIVGEAYYQEGTLLRNAFKMVPWVLLFAAWQFTADKEVDATKEGAGEELETKEEKKNSYSPDDY